MPPDGIERYRAGAENIDNALLQTVMCIVHFCDIVIRLTHELFQFTLEFIGLRPLVFQHESPFPNTCLMIL